MASKMLKRLKTIFPYMVWWYWQCRIAFFVSLLCWMWCPNTVRRSMCRIFHFCAKMGKLIFFFNWIYFSINFEWTQMYGQWNSVRLKCECTTSQLALLECPTRPTCKIRINQHQNRLYYFRFAHPYASDPPILRVICDKINFDCFNRFKWIRKVRNLQWIWTKWQKKKHINEQMKKNRMQRENNKE